ncbi:hypothetical protein BDN72DRAFT_863792 [Pluteus cervinus]|uniref:Uncharacterized protein n=1 Tax=Pluteus cervinus TaxID=181527 RepID=A0ACD3A645_9AGAR|nr:hypothetical protein BDN72DRAFT_863792 [Pluteus cervinus]
MDTAVRSHDKGLPLLFPCVPSFAVPLVDDLVCEMNCLSTSPSALFHYFDVAELMRLSRISKTVYDRVASYLEEQFSLTDLLRPYFTPPQIVKFRELQINTGVVITGTTAYHFLNRSLSHSVRLDLLVDDDGAGWLLMWFDLIGYHAVRPDSFYGRLEEYEDDDDVDASDDDDVPGATTLVQEVMNFVNDDLRQIRLVVSRSDLIDVILAYPITSAMNLISSTGVYSLYPYSTFARFEAVRLHNVGGDVDGFPIECFEAQGGTVVDDLSVTERSNPVSDFFTGNGTSGGRFVGDNKTWMSFLLVAGPLLDAPAWRLFYRDGKAYTLLVEPVSTPGCYVPLLVF